MLCVQAGSLYTDDDYPAKRPHVYIFSPVTELIVLRNQVVFHLAGPIGINGLLRYLFFRYKTVTRLLNLDSSIENGAANTGVPSWVWIVIIGFGKAGQALLDQAYTFYSVSCLIFAVRLGH
jgi:hypothetical protein